MYTLFIKKGPVVRTYRLYWKVTRNVIRIGSLNTYLYRLYLYQGNHDAVWILLFFKSVPNTNVTFIIVLLSDNEWRIGIIFYIIFNFSFIINNENNQCLFIIRFSLLLFLSLEILIKKKKIVCIKFLLWNLYFLVDSISTFDKIFLYNYLQITIIRIVL